MFVTLELDAFAEDSRGSSIESFDIVAHGPAAIAYMRGPRAAADQIKSVFRTDGLVTRTLAESEQPQWTHSFEFPVESSERVRRALAFFSEILIIPIQPPLRSLIALGFYKNPKLGQAPNDWENAPAGDMINRAKYQSDDAAHRKLIDELVRVVKRHRWYSTHGQVVVSVPGHQSVNSSYGERLAEGVARELGRPLVKIRALSDSRPAAKSAARAELDLSHEFEVAGDVVGKVVILVDDVYMTGRTMNNAAAALADSGARAVLGLVGARTMKAY